MSKELREFMRMIAEAEGKENLDRRDGSLTLGADDTGICIKQRVEAGVRMVESAVHFKSALEAATILGVVLKKYIEDIGGDLVEFLALIVLQVGRVDSISMSKEVKNGNSCC